MAEVRTRDDLLRALRALCEHFETDTIVVVGSQAILIGWPDAPDSMKTSEEIDAYPRNAPEWERTHTGTPASEEINALFGAGSRFNDTHGFYIDGVDDRTAKLPPGWMKRAISLTLPHGKKRLRALAPCLEDLVVSKLHRLIEKDKTFINAAHKARPLDIALIKKRLRESAPQSSIETAAVRFLDSLKRP